MVSNLRRAAPATASRIAQNDTRVSDATEAVLERAGWPGLSLTSVAVEAGLSRRAVHARFPTRSTLAIGLWHSKSAVELASVFERLLTATGLRGGGRPDRIALEEAVRALGNPTNALRAATEILLASAFDADLAAEVRDTLGRQVRDWCALDLGELAGHRGYVIMMGLGLLMYNWREDARQVEWPVVTHWLATALERAGEQEEMPPDRAFHMSAEIDFASGDAITDALLRSVLHEVARRGFDATTTAQIASAAGYSEGVLFKRYDTKLDLFLDATHRQMVKGVTVNQKFYEALAAKHGEGLANAVLLRESLHPDVWSQRATAREQAHLAWRNAEASRTLESAWQRAIAEMEASSPQLFGAHVRTEVHYRLASGMGPIMFPLLCPHGYELSLGGISVGLLNADTNH